MSREGRADANLVTKVDKAFEAALAAIDAFNRASERGASETKLKQLEDKANKLAAEAVRARDEMRQQIGAFLSEYTWEDRPEIMANPLRRFFFKGVKPLAAPVVMIAHDGDAPRRLKQKRVAGKRK